ncbi:hypothetical protein RvY_14585 [Ramazzottius varieornatus]|uniref:BTB domain-containing protein n=1 Tax=Ramazzottius varieornatus TaxID=947166 RepID=A0A1D1VRT9_RAMVA|nr:hypothetical protein RvY_14585 [Ramazzottius varieornatus]
MALTSRTARDTQISISALSAPPKLVIPIEAWHSNNTFIGIYQSGRNSRECELRLQPGDLPCIKLIMSSYSTTVKEKLNTAYRQEKQEFITVKLGPWYHVDTLKTCIDAMHMGKLEISPDHLRDVILTLQKLDVHPLAFSQIASALTGQHSAMGRLVSTEVLLALMEASHTSLEASASSSMTDSERRQMRSTLFALALEIARKFEDSDVDIVEKFLPLTKIVHWHYLCGICTTNFVKSFNLQRDLFPYTFFEDTTVKSQREFMHGEIVYRESGTKHEPTKEKVQVTFSMARQKMFLLFSKWSVDKSLDIVYKSPSPIEMIHLAKLSLSEVSQCFWEFCARKDMKLHRPFLAALGGPVMRITTVPYATPAVDNDNVSWSKVVNAETAPAKKRAQSAESSDEDSDLCSESSSEEPSSAYMKKVRPSVQDQLVNSPKVANSEAEPRSKSTVKKKRPQKKPKSSAQTP